MTLDDVIPLAFSGLAVGGSILLLYSRAKLNGLRNNTRRRYLLIDVLVVIAALEIMVDAIADITGDPGLGYFATVGRGAVTSGVLALLISFPFHRATEVQHLRRRND